MATFSPLPTYFMAAVCGFFGTQAVYNPLYESERFGLPLPPRGPPVPPAEKQTRLGSASPFIYLKGIREITWGLNFLALQYYEQDFAITIFAGIMALAELGDGWTVWANGGDRLRNKAFGHWGVGLGTAAWFFWRALQ